MTTLSTTEKRIFELKNQWKMKNFPIGFWNYLDLSNAEHLAHQQRNDFEEYQDCGFTLLFSPDFDAKSAKESAHIHNMLDWAAEYDMKMIVVDPRGAALAKDGDQDKYPENFVQCAQEYGQHEAFFGFHVGDEPHRYDTERYCWSTVKQNELLPEKVPFINFLPWWPGVEKDLNVPSWPEYLDKFCQEGKLKLLCYDHYKQLIDDSGVESYYTNLAIYRDASLKHAVPFWNTVDSVAHWRYKVATYDDLRWQFNTSLCAGAAGILWFFYYMRMPHDNYRLSPVDEFWEKTQTYFDLRRVHKMFHRLYGDLFNHLQSRKVMFYPSKRGPFAAYAVDDLIKQITISDGDSHGTHQNSLMIGEFISDQEERYVMLVNDSMVNNIQIQVEFNGDATLYKPSWNSEDMVLAELKRVENGNFLLAQYLAPGQELLFKLVF